MSENHWDALDQIPDTTPLYTDAEVEMQRLDDEDEARGAQMLANVIAFALIVGFLALVFYIGGVL